MGDELTNRTDMYDLEEQEQIDALKAWWKEHGNLVVTVLLAACVAAAGTAGWRWYRNNQAEQASGLYAALEKAMHANDTKAVRETAAQLMDKYGSTAYGPMAALTAAKINYDAGDATSAAAQLRWVVDNARDDDVAATARLRLAGVLLDQKKYDEALSLLDAKHPESFNGLFADRKGDIYIAQGKANEARAAYKEALEKLPQQGSTYRNIVQVKLDALGGAK
jgi:predicted negative regulator of RcsB-dependent stress response